MVLNRPSEVIVFDQQQFEFLEKEFKILICYEKNEDKHWKILLVLEISRFIFFIN